MNFNPVSTSTAGTTATGSDSPGSMALLAELSQPSPQPPSWVAQRPSAEPVRVESTSVRVPHPSFTGTGGRSYDPTIVNGAGRRWITADDLGRYLRAAGNTHLSAADLVAANPGKVQTLNGRAVFEVGTTVDAMPGAARIASAAGVDIFADIQLRAGVSAVVGGNGGGPVSIFALTPLDPSTGRPDFPNTKIFYAIPGTPIVGTVKPADGSIGTGFGSTIKLGPITLFGNVRLEVAPNTSQTGMSVNGGILFPLLARPGESAGVAASASVTAPVDWGLVMEVWSKISVP